MYKEYVYIVICRKQRINNKNKPCTISVTGLPLNECCLSYHRYKKKCLILEIRINLRKELLLNEFSDGAFGAIGAF